MLRALRALNHRAQEERRHDSCFCSSNSVPFRSSVMIAGTTPAGRLAATVRVFHSSPVITDEADQVGGECYTAMAAHGELPANSPYCLLGSDRSLRATIPVVEH